MISWVTHILRMGIYFSSQSSKAEVEDYRVINLCHVL
jgi:hypothetical protein